MNMTPTQQIFTVFFAIFWGAIANTQPKWKAFHYTFFCRIWQTTCRLVLAFLVLNVLPILYYCTLLSSLQTSEGQSVQWAYIALKGIVPAFAAFGFYRLFIAVLESFPLLFYRLDDGGEYPKFDIEPTIKSLGLLTTLSRFKNAVLNLLFALVYVLGAATIARSL